MRETEVLVIGAGPAGIAAATAAAELGRRVIVLDDNAAPGGQIWRAGFAPDDADDRVTDDRLADDRLDAEEAPRKRALRRLAASGAEVRSGYRVFDARVCGEQGLSARASSAIEVQALCESGADAASGEKAVSFHCEQLILATGARERFLPFPGWTLPGVLGAGGLQALVKGGFSVAGKRVVVAGSGPLLLAVAAHLVGYGAKVVGVAEQAPLAQLLPFAASLCGSPGKILQGLRYRLALGGAPYRTGCWPVEAIADASGQRLAAVRLTDGRRTWQEPCELLACGFHLVPNTEPAALLGCAMRDGFVEVDSEQRSSVAGIFCAGEPSGIAGLEAALVQGEMAGRACAGRPSGALQARAERERAFSRRLERAFALRPELRQLAQPETVVCRCEDVTLAQLTRRSGWTDAKLHTRCGMGACQGRICGPAVETLLGWKPLSVRPPLFPVPVHALCAAAEGERE